jgi:hypothetical protein
MNFVRAVGIDRGDNLRKQAHNFICCRALTESDNLLSFCISFICLWEVEMIALLIGILLILFAVFSVLPFSWSLNWWSDVIQFLKGGVPLIAVFIGLISFFVGVADIKDKIESKKEEEEEEEEKEEGEKE